jgi:hypothetical protein
MSFNLEDVRGIFSEAMKEYADEANAWWSSLPYEDQCKAFYAVVKRIHNAEVVDKGTFRYAIYDVFGFGPDMYAVAMNAGYMDIHNLIFKGLDNQESEL